MINIREDFNLDKNQESNTKIQWNQKLVLWKSRKFRKIFGHNYKEKYTQINNIRDGMGQISINISEIKYIERLIWTIWQC